MARTGWFLLAAGALFVACCWGAVLGYGPFADHEQPAEPVGVVSAMPKPVAFTISAVQVILSDCHNRSNCLLA